MQNLDVSYNTIKNILTKIPSYYISQGDGGYDIFCVGEVETITCHLSGLDTSDISNFETNYKSNCTSVPSPADASVLGKIANKVPFVVPKDANGIPLTITQPRTGDEVITTTHNFCDKSTWASQSIRVVDKTLTSFDGYQWSSDDLYWIDMVSGRVQDDDGLVEEQKIFNPSDPHGYSVVITVDDIEKTMRPIFENSGGDYEVFWEDGYIKSFEDWSGKTVKASYSKADGSFFILRPLPGKILNIEAAEADFSQNVIINDTIEYSVYGYVDIFAPQYMYNVGVGTATFTNNSDTVSGSGTSFTTEISPGMYVRLEADSQYSYMVVASVDSDTQLTLAAPYQGSSGTGTMAFSQNPTGVYPSGYKVQLTNNKYKRISQIFNEAVGAYPAISVFGATEEHKQLSLKEFRRQSRGIKSFIQSIPFRYATVRQLKSSLGLELHVGLSNNQIFGGDLGTLTFYCVSADE